MREPFPSARIRSRSNALVARMGEADSGEHPVDVRPAERTVWEGRVVAPGMDATEVAQLPQTRS